MVILLMSLITNNDIHNISVFSFILILSIIDTNNIIKYDTNNGIIINFNINVLFINVYYCGY